MSSAARPHTSQTKDTAAPATHRPTAQALTPDPQTQSPNPFGARPRLSAATPDPRAETTPAQSLALQRTVGNRAVQRLLAKNQPSAKPVPITARPTLSPEPENRPAEAAAVAPATHLTPSLPGGPGAPGPTTPIQRSTPGPLIQRAIGKGKEGKTVIRLTDGEKFSVMENYDDHEDDDVQYYDLIGMGVNEYIENVPHDTAEYDLEDLEDDLETPVTTLTTFVPTDSKYESLDDFAGAPKNSTEARKQFLLITYIDNCILAGLPQKQVVAAATTVLNKRGGWQFADFGSTIAPEFAKQLQTDIDDVSEKLIGACFTETPDIEQLQLWATERKSEKEEVEDVFELEDEEEFVETTAKHFLGDGKGFKKLWETSPAGQKRLIYSLMSVDSQLQRLSEIGYLLEAIDLPKHRYGLGSRFSTWANSNSTKPFFNYLQAQPPTEERPIAYFNETEREKYRLKPGSDMVFTNGEALDGDNIFVMSQDGKFYAGAKSRGEVNVHHSSFLAGQAVASAGHLIVNNGTLEKINLASGHYQPTKPHLARALMVLKKWGVDLTKVVAVAGESGDGLNAEEWLEQYLKETEKGKDEDF